VKEIMTKFEEAKKKFQEELKTLQDWQLDDLLNDERFNKNPLVVSQILIEKSKRGTL
jgi:hypothetical protein